MNSIKVTAVDKQGNIFEKTVKPIQGTGFHEGKLIIDFGWPMQYSAEFLMNQYPFEKPLCIDIGGGNHKGSDVTIDAQQMNEVIEFFTNKIL